MPDAPAFSTSVKTDPKAATLAGVSVPGIRKVTSIARLPGAAKRRWAEKVMSCAGLPACRSPKRTGVAVGLNAWALTEKAGAPASTSPRGERLLKKSAGSAFGAAKPSGTPSQLTSRRPDSNDPPLLGLSAPSRVRKASTVDWIAAGFAPAARSTGSAAGAAAGAATSAAATPLAVIAACMIEGMGSPSGVGRNGVDRGATPWRGFEIAGRARVTAPAGRGHCVAAELTTALRPSAVRLAVPQALRPRDRQTVRDLGAQPRSAARRALEREPAVERFHPVGEAAQARALLVGAADSVVVDRDGEPVRVDHGAHDDAARTRVLVHVGERLGDDVGTSR